jgi:hypothetical protein
LDEANLTAADRVPWPQLRLLFGNQGHNRERKRFKASRMGAEATFEGHPIKRRLCITNTWMKTQRALEDRGSAHRLSPRRYSTSK